MVKNNMVPEKLACPVCGVSHKTGWMLDSASLASLGDNPITGYALCSEHQELTNKGFLHLVVASSKEEKTHVSLEEAHRLGKCFSINRELAAQILGPRVPNDMPLVFVSEEAAVKIQDLISSLKKDDDPK